MGSAPLNLVLLLAVAADEYDIAGLIVSNIPQVRSGPRRWEQLRPGDLDGARGQRLRPRVGGFDLNAQVGTPRRKGEGMRPGIEGGLGNQIGAAKCRAGPEDHRPLGDDNTNRVLNAERGRGHRHGLLNLSTPADRWTRPCAHAAAT